MCLVIPLATIKKDAESKTPKNYRQFQMELIKLLKYFKSKKKNKIKTNQETQRNEEERKWKNKHWVLRETKKKKKNWMAELNFKISIIT